MSLRSTAHDARPNTGTVTKLGLENQHMEVSPDRHGKTKRRLR